MDPLSESQRIDAWRLDHCLQLKSKKGDHKAEGKWPKGVFQGQNPKGGEVKNKSQREKLFMDGWILKGKGKSLYWFFVLLAGFLDPKTEKLMAEG